MNNDLKQDIYEEPDLEVFTFGSSDIIRTSGPDNENQLPIG